MLVAFDLIAVGFCLISWLQRACQRYPFIFALCKEQHEADLKGLMQNQVRDFHRYFTEGIFPATQVIFPWNHPDGKGLAMLSTWILLGDGFEFQSLFWFSVGKRSDDAIRQSYLGYSWQTWPYQFNWLSSKFKLEFYIKTWHLIGACLNFMKGSLHLRTLLHTFTESTVRYSVLAWPKHLILLMEELLHHLGRKILFWRMG